MAATVAAHAAAAHLATAAPVAQVLPPSPGLLSATQLLPQTVTVPPLAAAARSVTTAATMPHVLNFAMMLPVSNVTAAPLALKVTSHAPTVAHNVIEQTPVLVGAKASTAVSSPPRTKDIPSEADAPRAQESKTRAKDNASALLNVENTTDRAHNRTVNTKVCTPCVSYHLRLDIETLEFVLLALVLAQLVTLAVLGCSCVGQIWSQQTVKMLRAELNRPVLPVAEEDYYSQIPDFVHDHIMQREVVLPPALLAAPDRACLRPSNSFRVQSQL
jgi:hypothetical protein